MPLALTNKIVAASVQTESPTPVEFLPELGEHKGPPLTKRNHSKTNLPKHMVFCPFLRFCLKGSNCDFSHSDLNQDTATNQPLSNESQLGNDQLPFLGKIQKNLLLTLNHIERTLQRMEVYQTIPPATPLLSVHYHPPLQCTNPLINALQMFNPDR